MELPFEKKQPTLADLKEKDSTITTKHYSFVSSENMNDMMMFFTKFANNPNKYLIIDFAYQTISDGSPFIILRYKTKDKIDEFKDNKIDVMGKLFNIYELDDLDAIINKHDKTNLMLLAEKRFTLKSGDIYILLIWAVMKKPLRSTETLDALRNIFLRKLN